MNEKDRKELREMFRIKFSKATAYICNAAIADCHDTLRTGGYPYESQYAQKLWHEIDAARDRITALTRPVKSPKTLQSIAN
jgi:hypothetical protein